MRERESYDAAANEMLQAAGKGGRQAGRYYLVFGTQVSWTQQELSM